MLAMAAYMLNDDKLALAEIKQANANSSPIMHGIAAIVYAHVGMMDDAKREGDLFVKLRPDFLPNVEAELRKRNFSDSDIARTVAGLRKAGLLQAEN